MDEAFISPVNEFGLSPLTNERRVNLRTMSARQLQRLETKVDERHGWALARSEEEVRELKDTLDEHNYEHLLEKEALVLRAKQQKKKEKESLTEAEVKHQRLTALLTVAEQDKNLLGRQIRGATIRGEKAEERIDALDDARVSLKVALEAKGRQLESCDADLKEAKKELRRVRMELNATCLERDLLTGKMESAHELETKWRQKSNQKMEALSKERDDLNLVTPLPLFLFIMSFVLT